MESYGFQFSCCMVSGSSFETVRGAQASRGVFVDGAGRMWLPLLLFLSSSLGRASVVAASRVEEQTCTASHEDSSKPKPSRRFPTILRPEHLPPPVFFDDFPRTFLADLPSKPSGQTVKVGSVPQINTRARDNLTNRTAPAEIAFLPSLVEYDSIQQILRLLRSYNESELDQDPDTVDGLPTYELFVRNPEFGNDSHGSMLLKEGGVDRWGKGSPVTKRRSRLRQQLSALMDPILDNAITPFIQSHFPDRCQTGGDDDRACTPCYSLIRRYRSTDRPSHGMHRDGLSAVTVVVSLSTYGVDYSTGGLYVSTGYGQRQFLRMAAGDAVAHTPRLLHGVQIGSRRHATNATSRGSPFDEEPAPEEEERWSWILWYRDSIHCEDHSSAWFRACAEAGDVICQELHAGKDGGAASHVNWNTAAAEGGSGAAAVKMARAQLGLLPGVLHKEGPLRIEEAVRYYQLAIEAHHPDGHYGMAQLYLMRTKEDLKYVSRVLHHLEAAAKLGHAYSMFNLGIAHTYGYYDVYYTYSHDDDDGHDDGSIEEKDRSANEWIDTTLAAEWFIASGLPEGLYVAAWQAQTVLGDQVRYEQLLAHAMALGYGRPWRTEARRRTGSGGATGVDLNLPWPPAFDGRVPPVF